MVLQDEDMLKVHRDLCGQLNLEEIIVKTSWDKFQKIYKNFTLEGDITHWLGCAIFEACQTTETTTIDHAVVRGNCVNFTSLLRHSNLSFVQFFSNMMRWIEMSRLPDEFQEKIKHLRSTFSVSFNTFKEYHEIYCKIFVTPDPQELDQSRQHRNRKQKPISCTSAKVFEFTWNLFNTIKIEEPNYCSDLTKSYHVLYSCIDLAFRNAFMSDRRDILRPGFGGLPEDWTNPGFEMPNEAPCLIKLLCKCDSLLTEAMHIKTYKFKEHMTKLIQKEILTGAHENFVGIFEPSVFEVNSKNISKAYEMHLLNKGGFDERIFLAEYRRQLLEQQQIQINKSVMSEQADFSVLESPKMPPPGLQTPLTGRRFLGPKNDSDISDASHSISWLHNMLNGTRTGPSDKLIQLFETCTTNPGETIEGITEKLGDIFLKAYGQENFTPEEASSRLNLATRLFYKFIESILLNEKNLKGDISAIVGKELFYICTFACSIETVIFVYDNHRKLGCEFPWILNVLNIKPYDFLKVIELIVRSKDLLSRYIIKHLNRAEETILESLAWTSASVLWELIDLAGEIPKFIETARPDQISQNEQPNVNRVAQPPESPRNHNTPHSATEIFNSPVVNHINRQLFPTVQAGQSVLQRHILLTDTNGQNRLIPIMETDNGDQVQPVPVQIEENPSPVVAPPAIPRKTGSLAIFFRKFYNLVGERLHHLCTSLGKLELEQKIWTIFEDSIINHTHLMKDRHLDQLLMCAVYVIAKVCSENIKFTDVMKCYRSQPQAKSDIYRNVLLRPKLYRIVDGLKVEIPEDRGDLINFYNNTYVNEMKIMAPKFAPSNQNSNVMLSPAPTVKRQTISSKVQIVGNVFVKPLESNGNVDNQSTCNHYFFNRSPSKDLQNINRAINGNGVIGGKRLLTDEDCELPQTKRTPSHRKIQSLVEERKIQNSQ